MEVARDSNSSDRLSWVVIWCLVRLIIEDRIYELEENNLLSLEGEYMAGEDG